ncbi:MAG: PEGA domain-containing protein [Candidatus Omnitrophica bacterium]|nr:PEGA domain-containing protein [Candidatus Omnitrophota bacterium]
MKNLKKIRLTYMFLFLFLPSVLFCQEGYLKVTSSPSNVEIEIDGKNAGKTPIFTVLKPGEYTIKATLVGYKAITQTVKIIENEVTILQLTMEKEITKPVVTTSLQKFKGKLTIITDREDVSIYLNSKKVDATPPCTLDNIPVGLNSIILVSGEYADSFRVVIQPNKTSVLKVSFEEIKKKSFISEQMRKEEIEAKRSVLPANVVLKLSIPEVQKATKTETPIWGESDIVEVSFQYKKTGEANWNSKELQSKNKIEDSFEIPKGIYEIQIIGSHYKEPTGIVNILLGAKKEKVREHKEVFKKEFQPDTQYTITITYNPNTGFSYKLEEKVLNTPIE